MSVIASKESVKALQCFFDYIGKDYTAVLIKPKTSGIWWDLYFKVWDNEDGTEGVAIGVGTDINGEVAFDPIFMLTVLRRNEKIIAADIESYESSYTSLYIDGEDVAESMGTTKKDAYGLEARFTAFMNNMIKGPYLTDPGYVEKIPKE